MSTAAIMSLLSATRTYLQIGCNDNNYFWLSCCLFHHRESGCVQGRVFEKEGTPLYTYFLFLTLPAILGRAACWFRVLFIENQYFPFLRMQNELLLRWALCRDWRLSLRHHSSEDFPKDIYFFSFGVNSATMDLPFSHFCQSTYHPLCCWLYVNKQTAWIP